MLEVSRLLPVIEDWWWQKDYGKRWFWLCSCTVWARADKNRVPELSEEPNLLSVELLMALTATVPQRQAGTCAVPPHVAGTGFFFLLLPLFSPAWSMFYNCSTTELFWRFFIAVRTTLHLWDAKIHINLHCSEAL